MVADPVSEKGRGCKDRQDHAVGAIGAVVDVEAAGQQRLEKAAPGKQAHLRAQGLAHGVEQLGCGLIATVGMGTVGRSTVVHARTDPGDGAGRSIGRAACRHGPPQRRVGTRHSNSRRTGTGP